MRVCAAISVVLVLGSTGCALRKHVVTASTPAGPAVTNPHMPVPPMAITVYKISAGTLTSTVVHVPKTTGVATAALHALGVDAPVTIAAGTATVDLPHALDSEVAEIVYTLTQFPTVQRVDVAGRKGLTRDDLAAYQPPILIDSPPSGATVPSTFTVSGSASVFEATLVVELVRDGQVMVKKTVTASAGAPARGTFSTTLSATAGDATIEAFAPSAADGTPQHEVDVPITVAS